MINIGNIGTQVNKNNIIDNQSELSFMVKENEQLKPYTHEQLLYIDECLETAPEIYRSSTLTKSAYPSANTVYSYGIISLPNEDMALIQYTSELNYDTGYVQHTYANVISYITQFSSQSFLTVLKILLKHEKDVILNEYHERSLEDDYIARCSKNEIYELNLQITELKAQVQKLQNY